MVSARAAHEYIRRPAALFGQKGQHGHIILIFNGNGRLEIGRKGVLAVFNKSLQAVKAEVRRDPHPVGRQHQPVYIARETFVPIIFPAYHSLGRAVKDNGAAAIHIQLEHSMIKQPDGLLDLVGHIDAAYPERMQDDLVHSHIHIFDDQPF